MLVNAAFALVGVLELVQAEAVVSDHLASLIDLEQEKIRFSLMLSLKLTVGSG